MTLVQESPVLTPELFAKTKNLTLCYQCFGKEQNPPLVLIMGLATQMIHWNDAFCEMLADLGFWVIRFDNRDIGRSEKLNGAKAPGIGAFFAHHLLKRPFRVPYYLTDMAQDTLDLMDYLGIAKAHLVGASMGGMIAQCMAIQFPERISSITSIMSTTGNRKLAKPKSGIVFKIIQPVPSDEQKYIAHVLDMWKMLHGTTFAFDEEKVRNTLLKAKQRGFYPAGIKRQTTAIMASPDRTSALQNIKTPTLVLHGDSDPLVPLDGGQATAKAIKHSKLVVYPGMGHTLPTDLWPDMIQQIGSIAS